MRFSWGPHFRPCAAGVLLVALSACRTGKVDDSGGVEDLTIVVEADKSRILQEEQSLQTKREGFEKERERLQKERGDVDQKLASLTKKDKRQREELESEQRRLAEEDKRVRERARSFESEREKLDSDKNKLLDRIAKMTATKGGLTIEQREQVIAQREKDVAERERQLADREAKIAVRDGESARRLQEITKVVADLQAGGGRVASAPSAPAAAAPSAGGATATRASVQKLQKQVRSAMETKGVLFDDLPPAAKSLFQAANRAFEDKDFGSAFESFNELEQAVNGISVNGDFVKAKMGRINRDVEKKSPDEASRKQIQVLLNDVAEAMNDGRYDRANKRINQIVGLLQK